MAIYMAKHYGCQVTTTTISQEQHDYTAQRILEEGLTDKIELLDQDYRLLEGQYDKIVSIEMVEAVGKQYLASYLSKCYSMLNLTAYWRYKPLLLPTSDIAITQTVSTLFKSIFSRVGYYPR